MVNFSDFSVPSHDSGVYGASISGVVVTVTKRDNLFYYEEYSTPGISLLLTLAALIHEPVITYGMSTSVNRHSIRSLCGHVATLSSI